jgi:hypothetical protein
VDCRHHSVIISGVRGCWKDLDKRYMMVPAARSRQLQVVGSCRTHAALCHLKMADWGDSLAKADAKLDSSLFAERVTLRTRPLKGTSKGYLLRKEMPVLAAAAVVPTKK